MPNPQKLSKQQEIAAKQQLMKLGQAQRFTEAKKLALQLVALLPRDLELWNALGQLQVQTNEPIEALKSFAKACSKPSPLMAPAMAWIVDLCLEHSLEKEGLPYAQRLAQLQPRSADAHAKLGQLFAAQQENLEARRSLENAVKLAPDNLLYKGYLAISCIHLGECEDALEILKKVVDSTKMSAYDFKDKDPEVLALWARNYIDGIKESDLFDSHQNYAERYGHASNGDAPFLHIPNGANKRIRIGLCSTDLYKHSVAYFLEPILGHYDRDKWEFYVYSDTKKFDEVSERLKSLVGSWQDVRKDSDEELCERIRNDQIDILIDLVGYIGTVRLGTFAQRAAPIQVNYLGYPNTTGLKEMDYRLTDAWADPEGQTDQYHSEHLYRLPEGFLCFRPDPGAPEVRELPALNNSGVTFGSFNIFQKISERNYRMWSQILKLVPDSKLLIKSRPLNEKALKESVWKRFEALGIEPERVQLLGWSAERESHLDVVSSVDIHLDTFPYNGTTTTCEALWQGVPSVTLAGNNHRTRVGLSLMTQVGLDDWVAYSDDDYIDIAVAKAQDLNGLDALRQGLRSKFLACALGDPIQFVKQLEASFDWMISRHNEALN